jgi:hypothetical protein
MNELILLRDDLNDIVAFFNKHPESNYITISSDVSSGIGSIVKASITTTVDGDTVTLTKTIADQSSW